MCRPSEIEGFGGTPVPLYIWMPEHPPARFVVQITHGMAEHAKRYTRLARYLNNAGAIVVAHDHRGHGRAAQPGLEGHYADEKGWQAVCEDLYHVHQHVCERWPALPRFMFAHSMGSFIAQSAITQFPFVLDGLILSGSNREPTARVRAARMIARFERFRQGPRGRSKLINWLSFGAFNQRFKPARTEFDWLSSDPDEVDRYIRDPQCGFLCTNETWMQLLNALVDLFSEKWLDRLPKNLPIMVLSGEKDPVGRYGRGPEKLIHDLSRSPAGPVTAALYPEGRHELVNESFRNRVMDDILHWIVSRLPDSTSPALEMMYTEAID